MKILKRHKNINGETVGYTVQDNINEAYLLKEDAIRLTNLIENARLLSNYEFRANDGCTIETVVDTSNLRVINANISPINISGKGYIGIQDYYGKGFLNICLKIRNYANKGNLIIDKRQHKGNNGKNLHLFKMIDACGISVEDFVKGYLSVLQPFSLTYFQESKELSKGNIWISDVGYGVKLVIKIDENRETPMVVSFHESNKNGSFMKGRETFFDKPCAVIVEKVNELPNGYGVDYCIQRGFIRTTIHSATSEYDNKTGVALVDYTKIREHFSDTMELVLKQLTKTYMDIVEENTVSISIEKHGLESLSFMSIGFATVNNISLLIDLYARYTDTRSRIMLTSITQNLLSEVPEPKLYEIKVALKEKYEGTRNKLYLSINPPEEV